eukprot:TRINITY_DN8354_c0_g1_i1.p1 TRINITY_DN8354_c0_g1~~TRINITY_DN8354_c0_g1_i1.p1  ORF type:complete len:130 (-),score=12.00 TRINITY_DN8354_c0_g1_i1:55-444(-)
MVNFNETILQGLRSMRDGDFYVRIDTSYLNGIEKEISETFNDVCEVRQLFAHEIERVGIAVGQEGKLDERLRLPRASGEWKQMIENLNNFIGNIVKSTTEVVRVIEGLAKGDLSQKNPVRITRWSHAAR